MEKRERGGERRQGNAGQDVKHFRNNADLRYEIKHGGRFGGGRVESEWIKGGHEKADGRKKEAAVLFGEELMRLR